MLLCCGRVALLLQHMVRLPLRTASVGQERAWGESLCQQRGHMATEQGLTASQNSQNWLAEDLGRVIVATALAVLRHSLVLCCGFMASLMP